MPRLAHAVVATLRGTAGPEVEIRTAGQYERIYWYVYVPELEFNCTHHHYSVDRAFVCAKRFRKYLDTT